MKNAVKTSVGLLTDEEASAPDMVPMRSPSGEVQEVGARHVGTLKALGYQKEPTLLMGESGKFFAFAPEKAAEALASGFRRPSDSELQSHLSAKADREKYGGTMGEVAAAGLGLARGITLGVSDLAIRAGESAGVLPEGSIEGARKYKEFNPTASLVPELVSFALPGLGAVKALGAAGRTAKLAGLGIAGTDAVGSALGKAATKIVGKEIGKYAAPAVKAAAEAAIFEAGHNISEESLANRDLTVESVFAHTGEAAILGGGIGAGLPLALRGAQKAAAAALDSAPVEWIVGSAGKQAAKFLDPQRAAQLYSGAMSKGSLLEDTPVGQSFQKSVKGLWDGGAYKGGIVDLDEATGLLRHVQSGGLLNQQAMLGRFRGLKDKAGKLMGDTVAKADDAVLAAGPPSTFGFSNAETDAIIDKIAKATKSARVSDATGDRLLTILQEDVGKVAGAKTFSELHEIRKALDVRVGPKNWATVTDMEREIVKDVRRTIADKIRGGMTELESIGALDPGALQRWNNSNTLFGQLKVVGDAIAKQTSKAEANVNVLGLRFRDIGIGAIGGGVLGDPAGIGIAVANKALQTDQGLLARAMLGEKLASLGWLQKTTAATGNNIAKSIASFVKGVDVGKVADAVLKAPSIGAVVALRNASEDPRIKVSKPESRSTKQQEWFAKTSKELIDIASDPQTAAEKQGVELATITANAPKTSDAMISKWLQINSYLLQKMPKNPGNPINILAPAWKPADYEINRFRDVVRVARKPLSVLDDLKSGTLTRAQTEAVQALYPSLYGQMMEKVREAVTKPGVYLPYEQRLRLGTLFPGVEASATPGFATSMASGPPSEKEKQNSPGYKSGGASKSKIGSRFSTKLDSLSTR